MKVCIKLVIVASVLWLSSGCQSPPAAVGFQNSKYFGLWYEVGKFETNRSFFYKDCACTQTDVKGANGDASGDATASYSCRRGSSKGSAASKTGTLKSEGPPGKWSESFGFFSPTIDYTVVYMDDNFALEYDCDTVFGTTNYCVHVLSRTRTIDNTTLGLLIKVVDELHLNNNNVKYQQTIQDGCPL